jgi:isocitrate lyase
VIIARTDAYGSANGDWEEHLERGRIYADAGVDLIWPEMPDPSREDAVEYAETIHETHPDLDLAFNYSSSFEWSAEDDPLTFEELGDLGYKYVFITLYGLHSGAHAVYEDMAAIADNGAEAQWDLEDRYVGHETESHHELSFVDRFQDIEARFDPEASDRMAESAGFSEDQTDPISTDDRDADTEDGESASADD